MNLQDYNKWAEWDYRMEHPECISRPANHRFPWYFKVVVLAGACVLWTLCILVEIRDWLMKSDPIEVFTVLWTIVCAGLFLAGMIATIWQ